MRMWLKAGCNSGTGASEVWLWEGARYLATLDAQLKCLRYGRKPGLGTLGVLRDLRSRVPNFFRDRGLDGARRFHSRTAQGGSWVERGLQRRGPRADVGGCVRGYCCVEGQMHVYARGGLNNKSTIFWGCAYETGLTPTSFFGWYVHNIWYIG